VTVFLDVSQLVHDLARTGIQRTERALIAHWPGPAALAPCRLDPVSGELRTLPEALLAVLAADAPPGGIEEERRRVEPLLRAGALLPAGARLLSAELFYDPERAAAYCALGSRVLPAWLIYDFLPWLRPDWYAPGAARSLMPYLRALRTVPRVAFISAQTRAEYARVTRRPADGPVLPLGGDGLGLERQRFSPERRGFVFLGTLEPRKNAAVVLRAFEQLWAEGERATLTLIGRTTPEGRAEQALLARLAADPRLRLLDRAPDGAVRMALREARALVFPSEGEGFGIPPLEALHAGVPAVIAASLPALDGLPSLGQVRLALVTEAAVLGAIRRLLDDAEAERLWAEAATLRVPTWRGFADAVAGWVQGN
jgi:glycosyltransferase involved in cell wall biosynthesis